MPQKLILITGTSSGLGAALVKSCLSQNYAVLAILRDKNKAGEISAYLEHPNLYCLSLDVTDTQAGNILAKKLADLSKKSYQLEAAIFNARIHTASSVEELSMTKAHELMAVNFFAVLQCVQAALPVMKAQGGGKLLAISSLSAHIGLAGDGVYAASKAALERLFESLQLEVSGLGIQVGVVVPGAFASRLQRNLANGTIPKLDSNTVTCLAEKTLAFIEAGLPNFSMPGDKQAEAVLQQLAGADNQQRQILANVWSDFDEA